MTYLKAHIEAKHDRKVGQKCNLCDFKSTSVQVFRDHMKCNHKVKLKCDMCGLETASKSDFKYANQRELTEHQKKSHKIRCTECDYEISTKRELKTHTEKNIRVRNINATNATMFLKILTCLTFTNKVNMH